MYYQFYKPKPQGFLYGRIHAHVCSVDKFDYTRIENMMIHYLETAIGF